MTKRPPAQEISYQPVKDAYSKKTLLLRDFNPVSMLHRAVHPINRAKFPAIDVHQHINDAEGIYLERIPPRELVAMMDELNLRTLVILTGRWGDQLQKVLDELVTPFPGRFLVFTQLDWAKINDADFAESAVEQLRDSVRRGATGLKFLKDLGLGVRDSSGQLLAIDDSRLDPVWEECGRLGIPVFIHTADPEAFFLPIDETNERYEQLVEQPTWSFFGSQFPGISTLLEARNRVFQKHPKTTFVSLHMGWPENLDWVEQMLRNHANVYVEFGAREAELGRQPRRTRKLFLDFQDRVMFGSDFSPEVDLYHNLFRWLETEDEDFEYFGYPLFGRWRISGLGLPDGILEKIYFRNAERLLKLKG